MKPQVQHMTSTTGTSHELTTAVCLSHPQAGLTVSQHFVITDLAPDDPEPAALLLCLGFVNVCYPLSKVEVSLWLALYTVNLDQSGVVCLVGLAPAWSSMCKTLGLCNKGDTNRYCDACSPRVSQD